MARIMVVDGGSGGSRNLRIAALLALMGNHVEQVTVADSYGPFSIGPGTHFQYRHNEVYRRLADDHDKYTEKKIQQRNKAFLKRQERKRADMARKLARSREGRFVRRA